MNIENLSYRSKLYVSSLLVFFAMVVFWKLTYQFSCVAVLVPLVILGLISWSYIDARMNEKYCFRNCYVENSSKISKFLVSAFFVIILYVLASSVMTLSLLYAVIDYPLELWAYFFIHFFLVVFLYEKIANWLRGSIKNEFIYIFTRGITIFLASLIFFLVYIYIFMNGYEPDYLRESMEKTLYLATNSISSSCSLIDSFLRFNREIDSMFWWFVKSTSQNVENTTMKSSIWISFIVLNGFAAVGINRLFVQIVHIINQVLQKKHDAK